jgi:hypothetical protein
VLVVHGVLLRSFATRCMLRRIGALAYRKRTAPSMPGRSGG